MTPLGVPSFSLEGNDFMALIMSENLKEAIKKRERLTLDKEESSGSRLIINMGKKEDDTLRMPNDSDLGINKTEDLSLAEVTKYVKEHTSDKKEDYDTLYEAGAIIVPFQRFVEMINDGANIYYSEVLNKNAISIKYQQGVKREGRGR